MGSNYDQPLCVDCPLESLYIGKNLTYPIDSNHGYSPFKDRHLLTDVRFSTAGTVTRIHDNLLWGCSSVPSLTLPSSLTAIGDNAFREMASLPSIVVPDNVTSIGKAAFRDCSILASAKLSANLTLVSEQLFSGCVNLGSISIPAKVETIDNHAFNQCSSLARITISPSVLHINNGVFNACESLANVTLEDGDPYLELGVWTEMEATRTTKKGLFRDCPVTDLHLGRWVLYDTESAEVSPFAYITPLKNLTIGPSVGIIGKYAFTGCPSLDKVNLPDCVESVGLQAFMDCSALKDLHLGAGLISLGEQSFKNCISLPSLSIPASLPAISEECFYGCTSLTRADLGTTLNTIGPRAFMGCTKLESIAIPESVYGLGVESFRGCVSLPSIEIPRGISSVGKQAFADCTGLRWASLSVHATSIGDQAFSGCTGLGYIKSYADFPPEGLAGFPTSLEQEGTLFVPEESIDYYASSPTWENFLNIRPINDNVLVSTIELDVTEASLKSTETLQLAATVGTDDATDRSIIWKSADETIATVDGNGLVTAIAVGNTGISAIAADGSGIRATCAITVNPTLVGSITLDITEAALKADRSLQLTAAIEPATATDPTITWSTSDGRIATVDENGNVTTIAKGNAVITATAADGSSIVAKCAVTVIPPIAGDSNDDDRLTVSDAVNTANYIVGTETEVFNFEAADINTDGRITSGDLTATVEAILSAPADNLRTSTRRGVRSVDDADRLVIEDFTLDADGVANIAVTLDNSIDYAALQADIIANGSLAVENVTIGDRASTTHRLVTRRADNREMRIVILDGSNATFADTDLPLLNITVKGDRNDHTASLSIGNILAADRSAREYRLTSTGGNNTGMTSIDRIACGNITVSEADGAILILNAKGERAAIYTPDGMTVAQFDVAADRVTRPVIPGLYIVSVGNTTAKVLVK